MTQNQRNIASRAIQNKQFPVRLRIKSDVIYTDNPVWPGCTRTIGTQGRVCKRLHVKRALQEKRSVLAISCHRFLIINLYGNKSKVHMKCFQYHLRKPCTTL